MHKRHGGADPLLPGAADFDEIDKIMTAMEARTATPRASVSPTTSSARSGSGGCSPTRRASGRRPRS